MQSYENLKPNSAMSLPPDPDLVVKELKHVHLQCCVCLNSLKVTLSLLNIMCYGWKVRGHYNRVKEQKV